MEDIRKVKYFNSFINDFDKWIFDNKLWHIHFVLNLLREELLIGRKNVVYHQKYIIVNHIIPHPGNEIYLCIKDKNTKEQYRERIKPNIIENEKYLKIYKESDNERVYIIKNNFIKSFYNPLYGFQYYENYEKRFLIIKETDTEALTKILLNFIKYFENQESPE